MTCRNQPGLDSNPSRWRRDSLIHDARGTSGAPSLCDSSRTAGVNELKLAQVYFLYFSLYLPRKNKTKKTPTSDSNYTKYQWSVDRLLNQI